MSYKQLLCTAAICAAIAVSATRSQAKDHKQVYNISAFRGYNTMPVNTKAAAATRGRAQRLFPGWTVSTDKVSGNFNDVYGQPVTLTGTTPADKAATLLQQGLSALNIEASEWQVVSDKMAPKAHYINYRQVVDGHAVVFSWLSFRFTLQGELARIQARNYGSPDASVQPILTAAQALSRAKNDLGGVSISKSTAAGDWVWFPIPAANNGYTLHPAWGFNIIASAEGSVPLHLSGYVDATDGTILYRTNDVKETGYDITVKGMVYKNGTLNPATLEPLSDLNVNAGLGSYFTDTAGFVSDAFLSLPMSTDIPLQGAWSTVFDNTSSMTPDFTELITLPGTIYTYPATSPSSSRDVNAYYHVTRVHNFMKKYYPSFTGMDFSLPTQIDVTGTCNAYYDGSSINFYAAGGGCNSFAEMGDVIYHEYGHGISDHFYTDISGTSIMNGALNEANSDIWALSITRNPILAANAFTPSQGFIRRYDMTPQVYPLDLDAGMFADPHKNGQIIAGTWWDVGVNISIDTMTRLFTSVYYDVPDGPDGTEGAVYQTILIDALMADDNNGNLMDGTPHYAQIVAAFAKHGIYLEQDATLTHFEPEGQAANVPIIISADLTIGLATYMHDLTLRYRLNGTGSWSSLAMTGSGSTYTGTIPAQPEGTTVEYYFVIHDALGYNNAYFPTTCNDAMPGYQTTIPYQFGVGIHSVTGNSFEGATTGWHIANNSGDNAVDGKWRQAVPSAGMFYSAWPDMDHTAGTGSKCLITGNGSSNISVANGTTTIITPVFDIHTYSKPIVEYYRWFSNEQGPNFKNDPWIVKINDASGTSWVTVENTYQPDLTWRHRIFPVSAFLPAGTDSIRLKFFASDSVLLTGWENGGQSLTVGAMDDFFLYDKASLSSVSTVETIKANIYPNPANNEIHIEISHPDAGKIGLYDVTGKEIEKIEMTPADNRYTLNTHGLAAGIYMVVVQSSKTIQSKKISIQH